MAPNSPNSSALAEAEKIHIIRELDYWKDLDRALIRLWELHAVRITITHLTGRRREDRVGSLMPESIGKGIVDIVESSDLF